MQTPGVDPTSKVFHASSNASEKEEEDATCFDEAKIFFNISSRLFGNRHCPAYLDNTSIEGASSNESVHHWMQVISLWLEGRALFFPVKIKKEHYERIHEVLSEYLTILESYHAEIPMGNEDLYSEFCREKAEITLAEIKKGLHAHKVYYLPLGYMGGVNGRGHALTAKFRFYRDKIEVLFLNVGEGGDLNPELSWSETSQRIHFQYFPIHLDPRVLFGEKGEHLFTRLIRLMVEPPSGKVQRYETKDIYGAFWLLGKTQSSFDSKPAVRAKKPQIDMNCGDMAITLLLRDLLIDFGYSKEQIQRFFCNELLSNLICFGNQLSLSHSRDEWLLLRAALEGFSVHVLHLCNNALEKKELLSCKTILDELFEKTTFHLKTLRWQTEPIPLELEKNSYLYTAGRLSKKFNDFSSEIRDLEEPKNNNNISLPLLLLPEPQLFLQTLIAWNKTAFSLHSSSQKQRAYQFVYRAMRSLPVPDPHKAGYWDEIPKEHRCAVMHALSQLVCHGVHREDMEYCSYYKQIFILYSGYAIADRLARLNEKMQLKGFASPFLVTNKKKCEGDSLARILKRELFDQRQEDPFAFNILPLKDVNTKWTAICHYFETHLEAAENSLFATREKEIDICRGADEISKGYYSLMPLSPTAQHLQYLKQFLPSHSQEFFEPRFGASYYANLWLNENGELPFEYNILYFFAYYSWAFVTDDISRHSTFPRLDPEDLRVVTRSERNPFCLQFPIQEALVKSKLGEFFSNLGVMEYRDYNYCRLKKDGRSFTENESMCKSTFSSHLKNFSTKQYRHWCRIFSNPSLQISATINWMNQYLIETQHEDFRNLIELALFDPGLLSKKINEEPQIMDQLRECVQKGLNYFSSSYSDMDIQLFFIRLGICLETYAENPKLEAYEERLLASKTDLWQSKRLLLLLYQIALPRGKESLLEMVKAQFWIIFFAKNSATYLDINSYPEGLHWIWQEIEWTSDLYKSELMEAFKDANWIKSVLQDFISTYSLCECSEKNPDYKAAYPLLNFLEFTLDFEQMTIKRHHQELLMPVYAQGEHRLMWVGEDFHSSLSGSVKFLCHQGKLILSQKFAIKDEEHWYYRIYIKTNTDPMLLALFSDRVDGAWDRQGANVFLITAKDTPKYLILEDGIVRKLTDKGELYLLNWRESEELSFFFKALGVGHQVCCWANPGETRIEEMEFLDLHLTFKGEEICGKWRLKCNELEGYYLVTDESLEEINHFRGVLILENGFSKAVVIPRNFLAKEDKDFTTEVFLTDVSINKYGKRFFFFQLDEKANLLISDDPKANLFLTLLLAMQRDYKKALCYLPRAAAFNYHDFELPSLFESFRHLKEHSPEALAFYLRFGLHIFDNQRQLLQKGFQKSESTDFSEVEKVYIWLSEVYEKYLRSLSTKEESKVPGYIRLTWEEELLFLTRLKEHLIEIMERAQEKAAAGTFVDAYHKYLTQYHWKNVFEVRQQLLKNEGSYYAMKIPVSEYSACLSEYQIIPLINLTNQSIYPDFRNQKTHLPAFVRMTLEEICEHFVLLYTAAKKKGSIQADLNILYLLRSQQISTHGSHFYASVLLYIHLHPEKFQDLSFGDSISENNWVFDQILERSRGLMSTMTKVGSAASMAFKNAILFPYQTSMQLKLPPPPKLQPLCWQFSLKEKQQLILTKRGLFNHFADALGCKKTAVATLDRPFAFDFLSPEDLSSTEKKYIESLKKGHVRLLKPKYGKAIFTASISTEEFIDQATHYLNHLKKRLSKIKRSAEKLVNAYPEIDFRIGLRKKARDLPEILVDGLLTEAYSKKDPMIIRKANPSLHPETIYKALEKTIRYHLLLTQIFQLESALHAFIKNKDIQAFGESIESHGNIDPTEEPEIILYQSRMRKVLHAKQTEVLEWYYKTASKVTLFAAPAGGGKTTIFQPIAMQRLKRQGEVAVSVSPQPLYLVDREGLRHSALHAHSLEIAVLELSLDSSLTELDFKRIYEELLYYVDRKGLKITPETYYALDLKYQLLLETGRNIESLRWVSLILNLFETKLSALIDESRVNLSPLSQAKIGIGIPVQLPEIDLRIFLSLYKKFVSSDVYLEDGRPLDKVVLVRQNLQATMDESDFPLIKAAVLESFLEDPILAVPLAYRPSVYAYLLDEKEEHAWTDAHPDQVRSLDLIKIYFDVFFASSMKLVGKMKHVRSTKMAEGIHVPARKRQASGAYFEEVYMTVIATIHGVLQEGLKWNQLYHLIELLQKDHLEEVGTSEHYSSIEKKFLTWIEAGEQTWRLKDFNHLSSAIMVNLSKNQDAIFWYLEKHILKQATYCPEQLIVTPIHFLNAFHRCTLFSADPGPQEIYGLYDAKEETVKIDRTFLAHVLYQLTDPKNEEIYVFPHFSRPLELFKWLYKHHPEIYQNLGMLADGGMLRDFTSSEVASDFFVFLRKKGLPFDFDGLILFEDASTKITDGELLLWLKDWHIPKILKGHDIVEAMADLGLRWEDFRLLTLVDPSHTTGANIKQKKDAKALVLLGEDFSLGDGIQTVMRMREFLINQTVSWGIVEELQAQIARKMQRDVTPETLRAWQLKNEAERIDKEIPLSAFQQIAYYIEKPARDELRKHLDDPHGQISIWKRYRKGFVKNVDPDLIKRFKQKAELKETRPLLLAFAEQLYNSFGYSKKWKDASSIHKAIMPIIKRVEEYQPLLSVRVNLDLMRQTHMHVTQKQEVELDQIQTKRTDIIASAYEPLPFFELNDENFIKILAGYSKKASKVFGSKGLTQRLWFSLNALNTGQTGKKPLYETYLKPVQCILIILEGQKWSAFALSDDEAAYFQEQLLCQTEGNRKIALLSCNGSLIQNGKGDFAFSVEELQSEFVQDVAIDVGLSQCELYHMERFLKRLETWDDFVPMWTCMKRWQTLPDEVHAVHIDKMVPKEFKEKEKEPEKQKKSFFSWLLS